MVQIISIKDAVTALLHKGAVGVFPTDTLYGLVARAADESAVLRLYGLKQRQKKPGSIIAASAQQLIELGVPGRYVRAVEHLWPNPLSIEIFHPLEYLSQGTGRQAFRVPDDEELRLVLEQTGPLLTSSVNHPSQEPAATIDTAIAYFGDKVDFYVNGGDLSGRKPSTIIRIIDDAIDIIRPGACKIDEQGVITTG